MRFMHLQLLAVSLEPAVEQVQLQRAANGGCQLIRHDTALPDAHVIDVGISLVTLRGKDTRRRSAYKRVCMASTACGTYWSALSQLICDLHKGLGLRE